MTKQQLKDLLRFDEIQKVIDELIELTKLSENKHLYNDVIIQASHFVEYQKAQSAGTTYRNEQRVEISKIKEALVFIIDQLGKKKVLLAQDKSGYYQQLQLGNPVYENFLFLNRTKSVKRFINFFDSIYNQDINYCPIIRIQTNHIFEPDWLFNRFFLELQSRYEETFELYPMILDEVEIEAGFNDFRKELLKKYKLSSLNNIGELLEKLSGRGYYLLHFTLHVKTESKALKAFITAFDEFCNNQISNVQGMVILTIRVTKTSFFKTWTPFWNTPKKSNALFCNTLTVNKLAYISRNDLHILSQRKLGNYPLDCRHIKKDKNHIRDVWNKVYLQIGEILEKI